MARLSIRERKLMAGTTHQAICTDCSYAGGEHTEKRLAEGEATAHVLKPGKENHIVKVVTRNTIVNAMKKRK